MSGDVTVRSKATVSPDPSLGLEHQLALYAIHPAPNHFLTNTGLSTGFKQGIPKSVVA